MKFMATWVFQAGSWWPRLYPIYKSPIRWGSPGSVAACLCEGTRPIRAQTHFPHKLLPPKTAKPSQLQSKPVLALTMAAMMCSIVVFVCLCVLLVLFLLALAVSCLLFVAGSFWLAYLTQEGLPEASLLRVEAGSMSSSARFGRTCFGLGPVRGKGGCLLHLPAPIHPFVGKLMLWMDSILQLGRIHPYKPLPPSDEGCRDALLNFDVHGSARVFSNRGGYVQKSCERHVRKAQQKQRHWPSQNKRNSHRTICTRKAPKTQQRLRNLACETPNSKIGFLGVGMSSPESQNWFSSLRA